MCVEELQIITVTEKPGVKPIAKNAKTILESWMLFFSNEMLEHIVNMTNIYIEKVRPNYDRERDVSVCSILG